MTTYRLSPEMNTWTPAAAANKQPASAGTLGEKGHLPTQRTGFNTLDNWGHKTPTQSKRKSNQKEKIKGSWPGTCIQYTRLHIWFICVCRWLRECVCVCERERQRGVCDWERHVWCVLLSTVTFINESGYFSVFCFLCGDTRVHKEMIKLNCQIAMVTGFKILLLL